ncbi:unnamed protein product, partial [Ixodes hexagonus]
MAEGGFRGYLCRYFLSGTCREGDSCLFSHELAAGVPDNVCRHYLKGNCVYGARCCYDHVPAGRVHANNNRSAAKGHDRPDQHRTAGGSVGSHEPGPSTSTGRQKQDGEVADPASKTPSNPANWIDAPEFVPETGIAKSMHYLEAGLKADDASQQTLDFLERAATPLCPFRTTSEGCLLGDRCTYTHGELCDLCNRWCLHPVDGDQRKRHKQECVQRHEEDMELSFAVQRSADKTCGICMDTVIDKVPASERRFGILAKCSHVFCLSCIRTWRGSKEFDSKTVRSCPECRIQSDFVTPSSFWVDAGPDKDKLITDYKKAMSAKPCRYFQEGRGQCPFGRACFYRHAYPDGREVLLPPPRPRRRRNRAIDFEPMDAMYLWDFID